MTERDWADWNRLTKRCPNCGAQAQTLGSYCPRCGKPFVARGLVDRLPIDSNSPFFDRLLLVLGLWVAAGFIWLAFTHPEIAIVVFGTSIALLVALVALNNWMLQR